MREPPRGEATEKVRGVGAPLSRQSHVGLVLQLIGAGRWEWTREKSIDDSRLGRVDGRQYLRASRAQGANPRPPCLLSLRLALLAHSSHRAVHSGVRIPGRVTGPVVEGSIRRWSYLFGLLKRHRHFGLRIVEREATRILRGRPH